MHNMTIKNVKIILPLHNEVENIKDLVLELLTAVKGAEYQPSILLVDDGSTDGSCQAAAALSAAHSEVSYISFSRNFGKETAIMAGLSEAGNDFDVLAYMDSDGQHSPDDLIRLLKEADNTSYDLICGVRTDRSYQTKIQRWMAKSFYRTFHAMSDFEIDQGVGDFNVMRPQVVFALRSSVEQRPFMKGLVSWVGFRRKLVPMSIRPRAGGTAKSSTRKMLKLAFGALLSFSSWPLRAWSFAGATIAGLSFLYLFSLIVSTMVAGRDVPGYPTIVGLVLFFGGVQLLSIGIVGEYIARIYDASKNRPRYIIRERG